MQHGKFNISDYIFLFLCCYFFHQVTRLVKVELKEGGAEVVLKKLSKSLDKDSVRVDGIGPASVTEVSFQVYNIVCHY